MVRQRGRRGDDFLYFGFKNSKRGEISRYGEAGPGPRGWLKYRFGLSWQIVPTVLPRLLKDPDQAKANRVMQAMMQMKKLDIARLEEAAAG